MLNGTVAGPVYASELLELQSQARVHGEVHYAALEMQQGPLSRAVSPRVQGETRALPAPAEAGASDAAAVGEDAGLANVADAEAASEGPIRYCRQPQPRRGLWLAPRTPHRRRRAKRRR